MADKMTKFFGLDTPAGQAALARESKILEAEMPKSSGKPLFREEQPDGRYTLYNWYHAPLATATLEELVPIIRAWEPPKPLRPQLTPDDFDLDTLHFNLDDLG